MNTDNIVIFIPARYKSTRLEGKPLLKINNKTIIQLTYEKAKKCKYANKVIVLTDDIRIKNEVVNFNGECMIITEDSDNGTERICCSLKQLDNKYDIIVNVQGDEPFIDPDNIDKCIENYINKRKDDKKIVCSTLHKKLVCKDEIQSCNIGKVVLDYNSNILYCSRTPIPVNKKGYISKTHDYYGDIGIFVYDRHYLDNNYYKKNMKNQLTEDIEWLKILEQGYKVNSYLVNDSERSLDTKEDYDYLLDKYSNKGEFDYLFDKKEDKLIYKATDSTFDEIYKNKNDPWNQSDINDKNYNSIRKNLVKLLNASKTNDNILEIGCGNGFSTFYLQDNIKQRNFYGCDISETAIKNANKTYKNITYFQHNIKNKFFLDIKFDYIIFGDLIWYILTDLKTSIENAIDKLNTNGKLIFYNTFLKEQKYGNEIIDGYNGLLQFFEKNYKDKIIYKYKEDNNDDYRYYGIIIITK